MPASCRRCAIVRRSEPPRAASSAYLAELAALAAGHGVVRFGVASADVLSRARHEIVRRRDLGLHDGMQFTYRNPERSTDPGIAVQGARSVLVGALPYLLEDDGAPPPDGEPMVAGRVARYAWADHYGQLRLGLRAVAHQLRRDGWRAVAYADDNSMVDREVAHRAGLGWFGKNANLLVAGAGSWFVLGSVVTTAPFEPQRTPAPDGCGTCRRCIDACPTGAIIADGVIDAGRCLSWLLQKPGMFDTRFRVALGDRLYGCDDCQEACPPTVHLGARIARRAEGPLQRTVDVLELLEGDDAAALATCDGWYISDRDPRWLRRNALIVLGNVGHRHPELGARVAEVVSRYLAADDPMLRAHAVWTARRLGLLHLLPVDDLDPLVRVELSAPS